MIESLAVLMVMIGIPMVAIADKVPYRGFFAFLTVLGFIFMM